MYLYMITELSNSKEKIFYILLPQGSSIFLIMPHRLMSSEKKIILLKTTVQKG